MRYSTICSALTSEAKVTECCCDLKAGYDLTDSIKIASVLFFQLTGRQARYAGRCTHTIRPWLPSECTCGVGARGPYTSPGWPNGGSTNCCCTLEAIRIPGACEVTQVVVDGAIVDPNTYWLDGDMLVNRCGPVWTKCQNMAGTSGPLNVFSETAVAGAGTVTLSANPNGTVNTGGLPVLVADSIVVKDAFGVAYEFPSVCIVGTSFDPALAVTDWQKACAAKIVALVANKVPFNSVHTITVASTATRTYSVRPFYGTCDSAENTFQITYRTGCFTPEEVQQAVAALACEIAKARCGDDTCRLPVHMRNFTRDGESYSIPGGFKGMTGIAEVDQIIQAINPHGLYRQGRLLGPQRTRFGRF